LIGEEETSKAASGEAARSLDAVWQQMQQLREQDKRISAHLDQLREQLQNDRGRLASLEALQEAALSNASTQVSGWLENAPLADRRVLAQRLVVEPGWGRAVETVLGSPTI
jgi:chromosome segregation protein